MNNNIKSIEIFPQLTGEYDSISTFPSELTELIFEYIEDNKITVRIRSTHSFMKKVYNVCDKYNIRCQKYIS
jgi:hypothetical protein